MRVNVEALAERDKESTVTICYRSHHHIREHGNNELCAKAYVNLSANDRILIKSPNSVLYMCLTQSAPRTLDEHMFLCTVRARTTIDSLMT